MVERESGKKTFFANNFFHINHIFTQTLQRRIYDPTLSNICGNAFFAKIVKNTAEIYLLQVHNKNTRARCKINSKGYLIES